MAGRALITLADGESASSFAQMLGGLIEANLEAHPERRSDFDELRTVAGVEVTDIDEAVTLVFGGGRLDILNGLRPERDLTIRGDSDTIMQISSLRIGPLGLPVYVDATGREVVRRLLSRKLKIEGMVANVFSLNALTRILSVR